MYNLTVYASDHLVPAYCDKNGWTIIQSRGQHGNQKDLFYKGWKDYEDGFGVAGNKYVPFSLANVNLMVLSFVQEMSTGLD